MLSEKAVKKALNKMAVDAYEAGYNKQHIKASYEKVCLSIMSSSSFCEALRRQGLFFSTIATALEIDIDDIEEIVND